MVTPVARREAGVVYGVSEWRARQAIGVDRSSVRYRRRRSDDGAQQHRKSGAGRLCQAQCPGIATGRDAARNRASRPVPLQHRARQAQMANRLYSSVDEKRGAGQQETIMAFTLSRSSTLSTLSAATLGCLQRTSFTTDWGLRLMVRYSRPRYSPTIPRIRSCTPESRRTAAISDAQPGGGDRSSASPTAIAPPRTPNALRTRPVNVLIRKGMTEKFTNIFIHNRISRRI